MRLMVRLAAQEAAHVRAESRAMGLPPATWVASLVGYHAGARRRFSRDAELSIIATQGELRRIGVNVNQIARALNTAVMEGRVLAAELGSVDALRVELRAHMAGLRDAFHANLAYWDSDE
ncbi:plasmid mobilization relaxosome protein MobC [Phenylobacterium sp.]|uniref:plasmid mobilization relaxosome protein MobC n=1 Tax=Phenylobacterium sp. TaxID=1871053 RepID=UPI0035AFCA17